MKKPYIIGISGESGVGKSTIAEIITLFFDIKNTITISTDDLHKWERTNPAWENITHLNPEANNLELGDIHVMDLSQGKSIYRSIYNHHTGNFNPPIKIEPKEIIIMEGLHAFYTEACKNHIDLKIFIDTDEDLRTHWKIIRDTEERGYKYNQVLDIISKRKFDSDHIRNQQIGVADVIVTIAPKNKIICLGNKNEKIDLEVSFLFNNENIDHELFSFIKKYTTEFDTFSKLSETVGNEINLCQNGGGNISIKISPEHLIIKSSGFKLKDVYKKKGYCIVNYKDILSSLQNKKMRSDHALNEILTNSPVSHKYKRPSMETGFHALLESKYIIHLHPIYTTLLLCLDNSEEIISSLFSDYEYIKYQNPGYHLYKTINLIDKNKSLYFLENHGIIIASQEVEEAMTLLNQIENKSKAYIQERCSFQEFDLNFSSYEIEKHYAFPDAVMFVDDISKTEIIAAHNYINFIGKQVGKLRHLSSNHVHQLKNLESEKYRGKL